MKKRHPAYPKGADYEVGFGRPPVAGRFVKGRSGNPKGRPKTPKTAAHIVLRLFTKKMKVTVAGRTQKVTGLELLLLRQYEKAANGDTKALGFLLSMNEAIEEVAERATNKKELVDTLMSMLDR